MQKIVWIENRGSLSAPPMQVIEVKSAVDAVVSFLAVL